MANPQTSAEPRAAHWQRSGAALVAASALSNQTGAAFGARAFDALGPLGVVIIRQLVSAVVLMVLARPRLRVLRGSGWVLAAALAVVFGVMNLSLYLAIDRLGLGLAVTLEYLGPLAVALCAAGSHRARQWALVVAGGVVLLCAPGPSSDVPGLALGLLAAAAWAAFIVLNRSLGSRLDRLTGAAAASLLSALAWLPIAIWWFSSHAPQPAALGLALTCALLSSVVPQAVDLIALRRISSALFGVLTALNPVWAAGIGWLMLGQALDLAQLAGVGLIVAGGMLVSRTGRASRSRP
ncbi:EamA family transporter [Glutamicibacter soli]|uniref:EamA family transporter n=1 Tax=Glutamicibacter soli TaxID=453836 RepID=UPI003FD2B558